MKPTLALLLASALTATCSSFLGQSRTQHALTSLDGKTFPVNGSNPLLYCADPEDYSLQIHSVDIHPNPPKAGQNLTITASGTTTKTISDGARIRITVKYGLVRLLNIERSLCDVVDNVNLTCPIHKGDMTLGKVVELPEQIPPGKYTVQADLTDKDDKEITCLTATVQFH